MDRILDKNVRDFLAEYGLESIDEGKDFERFVVHSVISSEYDRELDIDDVKTTDDENKGNDIGSDGIAIIINGKLANNVSVVEDILQGKFKLNVTFVFVQATLQGFDSGTWTA